MLTPKRPEATCLIFERRSSPNRSGSSPPSPVFDRPPMRFIATASVSCASRESEPSDIAPVENRLTISAAGSTSSSGIGVACRGNGAGRAASSGARRRRGRLPRIRRTFEPPPPRTACCSSAIVSGFHWWCSPPRARHTARSRAAARRPCPGRRARAAGAPPRRLARADAADARRRPGEVAVAQLRSRARRPRRSARRSRRDGRDAHLRDRLQQALADRLERARSASALGRSSRPSSASRPIVASIR